MREFGEAVIMDQYGMITCKESLEPGLIVYLNRAGVHGSLTFVEMDCVNVLVQSGFCKCGFYHDWNGAYALSF